MLKIKKSSVKVLHCYRTYFPDPPGGIQEAINQIALSTAPYDVESRVFALSPAPTPEVIDRPEGGVIRSRSWCAPASCDLGGVDSFIKFRQSAAWADLIHYHFPWPFADFLHLLVNPCKPTVMTYHSDIVRQRLLGKLYAPMMRRMIGSMSAVVATSPAYAQTSPVINSCVLPERLRTIPLGIADFQTAEIDTDLSTRFLDKCTVRGEKFVLALGALRYYKGFHTLIEAAASIKGLIVIAGAGPEEQSLKKLATIKGVNNVVFVGQVSNEEKITLLRACSAFALPSHLRSEAFGMVLVEAAMFSKPMVCCDIGSGTSYVNKHGETGFVVPPESPTQFAEAVNSLLLNNQLAIRMGQAARSRYEMLFSGLALGGAYSKLYREVVETELLC